MGNQPWYVVAIDPWPVRSAAQIAQEVAADVRALADEIAPASSHASLAGLDIGAILSSVSPTWEDHLRAVGTTIDDIGSKLILAADDLSRTDDGSAQDIQETTTTRTTTWPGY
jgi:hypothetical protein